MASPAPQKVGPLLEDWSCLDVARWLRANGHGDHTTAFLAQRIDGPVLLELTLGDMEQMGMAQAGARRRLVKQIDNLAMASGMERGGSKNASHGEAQYREEDGLRDSRSSSGSSKGTDATLPSWERGGAHSVPPGKQSKYLEDV
eukprot:CAMPEP_0173433248 /NCGR_PEP_ID=MMETSP1357-20121228/10767_1 /TAXON_ID=77926 /ORGANISM="Hemiselmis rufescens, Strain PCC563" /LENGTH=143 /DNA_ID=CAMNT_0014397937 /DNA_START=26 /DNA_END=454 /DNA_ORIENTATION=+